MTEQENQHNILEYEKKEEYKSVMSSEAKQHE